MSGGPVTIYKCEENFCRYVRVGIIVTGDEDDPNPYFNNNMVFTPVEDIDRAFNRVFK